MDVFEQFSLTDKVAIVTGGTGVLGSAFARGLAAAGAKVGILGRRRHKAEEIAEAIEQSGGTAVPLPADVLDKEQLKSARDLVLNTWGHADILVNAAGGNMPEAIIFGNVTFFDMPQEAFEKVMVLNLTGTISACQIFGEVITKQKSGSIINISSMAATQAITRVLGYSVSKAGIDNFTRWLAVEFAHKYGDGVRVNAIAPGFFIGEQNRNLLLEPDGSLTERGKLIIQGTPTGRFGEPEELVGTAVWLASDASKFVTGTIIPVDGGFSVYSGV
jgi:NAD(P)-dependent dehydrogenase (short-subunit alcohol dehydrogenase family)